MPFVVTEPCVACKHTDCVDVCPMDCFVEGPNFVAIDPGMCIDCAICVPECPVDAIVNAAEVTDAQRPFIALNAQFARDEAWRPLTRSKPPLEDHVHWGAVMDKRHLIQQP
jgi:ferredoxin